MTFQTKTITVPVFAPKPITAEPVPQNPSLAPNGRSNMHNDAYMSDTYNWAGPVGGTLSVGFKMLLGECACLTFDSTGRIVTVSSGKSEGSEGTSRTLLVLDPDSLDILASMNLPSGGGGSTGFGGGGYICLNDKDQAIIPTANQQLWIVDVLPGRRVSASPAFMIYLDQSVTSLPAFNRRCLTGAVGCGGSPIPA